MAPHPIKGMLQDLISLELLFTYFKVSGNAQGWAVNCYKIQLNFYFSLFLYYDT
jgi:hypothetical protein